jgi:flagellar biosynthetic protein FliR
VNAFAAAGLPDFFASGVATAFVLTALRVGGLLLVAPVWSAKTVPMRLRTALLVVFAVLLSSSALSAANLESLRITPATFLSETIVGFAIGLAAAIVIAAAEMAGDLMTMSIGLSGAAIFDPVNNTQGALLGNFFQLLALVVLLIGGGHLIMLRALADSFTAMPLGAPIDVAAGMGELTRGARIIFSTGLQFAAPVIAAVLLTNIALAILGRVAPKIQIMTVAFPMQICIGLFALAGSLTLIVHAMSDWTPSFAGTLDSFARATRGGSR